MSFRGVHSSSPAPMRTIPSASTRRHFDSFELLRGAAPKPQFLPTVDPITTGPTGELRESGKGEEKLEGEERDTLDRSTSTGIRASKTPICDHEIRNKLETTEPPETGGELPLDA